MSDDRHEGNELMEKFDFDKLPPEIAAVLRDVLNWRIARDLSKDAIAEGHIYRLDDSSIALRDWVSNQGEVRHTEFADLLDAPQSKELVIEKRDTERRARQKRITASPLRRVNPED